MNWDLLRVHGVSPLRSWPGVQKQGQCRIVVESLNVETTKRLREKGVRGLTGNGVDFLKFPVTLSNKATPNSS